MAGAACGEPDRGGEEGTHQKRDPTADGDHGQFTFRMMGVVQHPGPFRHDNDGRNDDDQHADDGELPAEVGVRTFPHRGGDLLHCRRAGLRGQYLLSHSERVNQPGNSNDQGYDQAALFQRPVFRFGEETERLPGEDRLGRNAMRIGPHQADRQGGEDSQFPRELLASRRERATVGEMYPPGRPNFGGTRGTRRRRQPGRGRAAPARGRTRAEME